MVVGRHHGLDRFVLEQALEQRLPQLLRGTDRQPGVDDPPAIGIFQQVEVDVVQRHRQRHAQPQHAGRDFPPLPGRGHVIEQILEHVGG
jgi:hypothetical protein